MPIIPIKLLTLTKNKVAFIWFEMLKDVNRVGGRRIKAEFFI